MTKTLCDLCGGEIEQRARGRYYPQTIWLDLPSGLRMQVKVQIVRVVGGEVCQSCIRKTLETRESAV